MKKRIIVIGLILALLAFAIPMSIGFADNSGEVTCTVSATAYVSITVTDGLVDYGSLSLSETKSTNQMGETQKATNNGTLSVNLEIKGSDASAATGGGWSLGGSPGADQFAHKFSIDSGLNWTSLSTGYQPLVSGLTPASFQNFDLQLMMPVSVSNLTAKTTTVTIQASSS